MKCWHSDKKRAAETAEMIASTFTKAGKQIDLIGKATGLNPFDCAKAAAQEIGASESDGIVVGHLPMLQMLAGELLSKQDLQLVQFTQSGIVVLERTAANHWQIVTALSVDDMKTVLGALGIP